MEVAQAEEEAQVDALDGVADGVEDQQLAQGDERESERPVQHDGGHLELQLGGGVDQVLFDFGGRMG